MVMSMQPGKRRLSSRQLYYFLLCLFSFSKCSFECNNTMIALVNGYITCIVYLHLLFLNCVNGLSCDCWVDRWIAIHPTKQLRNLSPMVNWCTSKSEVEYPSIDTWQDSSVGKVPWRGLVPEGASSVSNAWKHTPVYGSPFNLSAFDL